MPLRLRLALGQRAFHLLYTGLAPTYDAVAWAVSLGQWREWGQAALPYLSGPRVLELGHGPGHMLAALAAQGYEAVGLDLSPQMGRLARRQQPTPRLVRARAQVTPFAAGSFDGVLATFPTAYITAPATVAAVYRLLRPGGRLVIVPEARLGGPRPVRALVEWLYTLTGQRATTDDPEARLGFWTATLAGPGFAVSLYEELVRDSVVTVVVAERPPGDALLVHPTF
jgi:ubiquinone/menaquinone biosynthesis C-methylase UbiE